MLRTLATTILILAGGVFTGVLLCLLILRLAISAVIALSGVRRQGVCGAQVLDW